MFRRIFLFGLFFLFVFLSSGCTVIQGAGGAVSGFAVGAVKGGQEGFKEDMNLWQNIQKADDWVKKNLW